jgi:phosphoinositide-3-kinase regulatory subunit 4
VFPASFYDYFHDFVASTNEISAVNPAQSALSRSGASVSGTSTPQVSANNIMSASAPDTDSELPLPTNADEIINRIWTEYEQIERRLDPEKMRQSNLEEQPHTVMTSAEVSFRAMGSPAAKLIRFYM